MLAEMLLRCALQLVTAAMLFVVHMANGSCCDAYVVHIANDSCCDVFVVRIANVSCYDAFVVQ